MEKKKISLEVLKIILTPWELKNVTGGSDGMPGTGSGPCYSGTGECWGMCSTLGRAIGTCMVLDWEGTDVCACVAD